jgi:hypothetical protein
MNPEQLIEILEQTLDECIKRYRSGPEIQGTVSL